VPESAKRAPAPRGGGGERSGLTRGGRSVRLVPFRGLLPPQPAAFLGRLSPDERFDVHAILGTYREVRGLIGAARLLHLYLKEAPRAAARGTTTLGEILGAKEKLAGDIWALRQQVQRLAESLCLVLPTFPKLN
jgi:hypothetical protein